MRKFKFEISEDMLTVISTALAAQPYRIVHEVIDEMQRQLNEQLRPTPIRDHVS